MKNPQKLQEKLVAMLPKTTLKIQFPYNRPWSVEELNEVAWMIEDYVNRDPSVINSDPLKDWVEEYKFFKADFK